MLIWLNMIFMLLLVRHKLYLMCCSLDIAALKVRKGVALQDILTEVHLLVHRSELQ